jgi:hypothetical protein
MNDVIPLHSIRKMTSLPEMIPTKEIQQTGTDANTTAMSLSTNTEKPKKLKPGLSINVQAVPKQTNEEKQSHQGPHTAYLTTGKPRAYGMLRRPSAEPTLGRHSS